MGSSCSWDFCAEVKSKEDRVREFQGCEIDLGWCEEEVDVCEQGWSIEDVARDAVGAMGAVGSFFWADGGGRLPLCS